ncbi:MAG: Hint domain-containing protein [Paracoccaceae bacterium]
MLNPGDLMFVGWDGDAEDVAFVATSDIAGGQVLYFTDSEWNRTAFLPGEQLIEWQVPPEGIAAGTLLTLDMVPGGSAQVTTTADLNGEVVGTIDYIQGGGQLAPVNEMLWVFQGTRTGNDVTPENFVAVIGNEADGGNRATPNLTNTGLDTSNGAIIIDGDHDYMVFDGFDSLPNPVSAQGAIAAISDLSNWSVAGGGRNNTDDNPNPTDGFDLNSPRFYDANDVTTLYFDGTHVAFIDDVSSPDNDVTTELSVSEQPFLPTDIIEIDILNSSLRPDGEFDFDEVIFTRVAVTRNGVTYEFSVNDGSKVKESGATDSESGQAVEQGDTFFVTNDDVNSFVAAPVGSTPFAGIPSGRMAFSLNETFVDGGVTSIVREQTVTDEMGDEVGVENANFYFGNSLDPNPVPCFARGTRLQTDRGLIPVEQLTVGDLLQTRDNGMVPIRWIGRRAVRAQGRFAPIRVRAHAMDNEADFWVSQNHKLLVSGWQAQLLLGEDEVLVPAKHLVDGKSVTRETGWRWVEYFHVLLDRHEVIYAEGCATESLNPDYLDDWLNNDLNISVPVQSNTHPCAVAAVAPRLSVTRHEGRMLRDVIRSGKRNVLSQPSHQRV